MNLFKNNKQKIIKWLILLFALFPIIPNSIKGLPVVLLVIFAILLGSFKNLNIKKFLGYSFLFILYIYSLLFTSNIGFAYKKIETALSIILIPFVFYILLSEVKIKVKIKLLFAKTYIISTTIFSILSIIIIFFDTKTSYYKNFYSNKFRIIVENLPLIGQHPIYASLFLGLAIIFNIFLFYKHSQKKLLYPLFINTTLLLMLSSKGVIISLMIIILLFLFFISKMKLTKKIYLFSLIIIGSTAIFSFNRRMQELLNPKTYLNVNPNYSNSYRLTIMSCSTKLIKENWFFGYGVGDAQDKLDACYKEKSSNLLEKTYNSHNQYLDIWLKTGIIGFLYFAFFLFYLIYKSLKNKNYLFFSILILYTVNFLFENVLSRQSGVILFYFLICLFSNETLMINKYKSKT